MIGLVWYTYPKQFFNQCGSFSFVDYFAGTKDLVPVRGVSNNGGRNVVVAWEVPDDERETNILSDLTVVSNGPRAWHSRGIGAVQALLGSR